MTKPVIVTRSGKGVALTYEEQDANFTNLQNATITVTNGTTSHAFNLNDTITFTAGTNITIGVNSTTGAITINSTGGTGGTLTSNLNLNENSIVNSTGSGWLYLNSSSSTGTRFSDVGGTPIEIRPASSEIYITGNAKIYGTTTTAIGESTGAQITTSSNLVTIKNSGTSGVSAIAFQNTTTGTPSNTSTPNGWLRISVGGVAKFIPYYA